MGVEGEMIIHISTHIVDIFYAQNSLISMRNGGNVVPLYHNLKLKI